MNKPTANHESQNKKPVKRTLPGLITFLFHEILTQKKWVLLPLWALLAAVGILLIISGSSSILPAVYIIGF